MNYRKLVRQILSGSKSIDHMRKEILLFIGMLPELFAVSLAGAIDVEKHQIVSKKCIWTITVHNEKLHLFCTVNIKNAKYFSFHKDTWVTAYNSDSASKTIRSDLVQNVYENLPLLLEGMLKMYPFKNLFFQKSDHFISASKIKF